MAQQSEALFPAAFGSQARRGPGIVNRLARVAVQKPLGTISLVVLVGIWAACLLAPLIAPYYHDTLFVGGRLDGPSWTHLFGTDQQGRDVLSRILYGGRITLTLSLVATVMSMILSLIIGISSGYLAGLFDLLVQRLSDTIQALPGLVVLLVIGALFNGDKPVVLTSVAILSAPAGARLFRSAALTLRNEPFVEAAQAMGATHTRIVARHILPNVLPLTIVLGTVFIGANVLLLASLSFLGIINADGPDWGTMLNASSASYMVQAPWLVIVPASAITLVVLAYNLLGDAMRDILDPRLRRA
jgi:peptide/nickel transport system permease protein